MKGLLYKDFQLLANSYKRNILTVLLLYAAIIILSRQLFVAYALVFLAGVYVSSTISFDEQAHWDSYARTLPVSAGQIVAAKYLLNLAFMLAAAVCTLLLLALQPLYSDADADSVSCADSVLSLSGTAAAEATSESSRSPAMLTMTTTLPALNRVPTFTSVSATQPAAMVPSFSTMVILY